MAIRHDKCWGVLAWIANFRRDHHCCHRHRHATWILVIHLVSPPPDPLKRSIFLKIFGPVETPTQMICPIQFPMKFLSKYPIKSHYMGMDQYLLIPLLVGWTSIYQLFWCSPGVQGFDTLPYKSRCFLGDILHRFHLSQEILLCKQSMCPLPSWACSAQTSPNLAPGPGHWLVGGLMKNDQSMGINHL